LSRGKIKTHGVVKKQPAKRRRIPEKGILRFIMSDVMLVDSFKLKKSAVTEPPINRYVFRE